MRRPLVLLLIALPAAAMAQPADPAPDTTLAESLPSLRGVTVTAARVPVPTRDAGARVTVLDSEAIAATGAASVADLLEKRAPVFVRRYGPSGLATLSLRGAGSAQTLLLLDGQRLTDPQLGQLDLSLLPTVLLDGVEVLHGAASALHGADALGGVVHLRALRPGDGPALRLTSEAGAWGQGRLGAVATAGGGGWSGVAAVEAERADEDFFFRDPSRLDGRPVRHAGWDRRRAVGYAALGYEDGRANARATLLAADAERGLGGTDSVGARQWDSLARLHLDGGLATRWGRIEAGGAVQRGRLRYASPFPATRADALDETGRTTTASLDVQAHVTVLRGWAITAGGALGLGRADHPSLADNATDRRAALFLSADGQMGRARLFPALRLDRYWPAGGEARTAFSPQLGLNVRPFASDALRLKASTGRAFRMPTLNDRFWQPGGNPDLKPERGWTLDGGIAWTPGRTRFEITAFASAARDQIVWRPSEAGYWAPENLARTRTRGLEASSDFSAALSRRATAEAGLAATLTDARDRSERAAPSFDQKLRYVPRWTAKAWGGLALARVAGGALRLDAGAQAVGRRYVTSNASQSLPAYVVLDGQARYTRGLGRVGVTLALAVENLTGARYEVVQSYPMPPRHLRVRLLLETR